MITILKACPRCITGAVKQDYEPFAGQYKACMSCGWVAYL